MEGRAPRRRRRVPGAGPRRGCPHPRGGGGDSLGAAGLAASMYASTCARVGIDTARNAAITIQYAVAAKKPETMVRMAELLSVWDPLLVLAYGESVRTVSGLQSGRIFRGPGQRASSLIRQEGGSGAQVVSVGHDGGHRMFLEARFGSTDRPRSPSHSSDCPDQPGCRTYQLGPASGRRIALLRARSGTNSACPEGGRRGWFRRVCGGPG